MSPIVQGGDNVANMRISAWTGVLPPNDVCGASANQQVQWLSSFRLPWMVRSLGLVQIFELI